MVVAKNPNEHTTVRAKKEAQFERRAGGSGLTDEVRKHTGFRIKPSLLLRADEAAERLGLTRSMFIALSIAEKLEGMNA